jgi:hypothetical protein
MEENIIEHLRWKNQLTDVLRIRLSTGQKCLNINRCTERILQMVWLKYEFKYEGTLLV